MRLIGGTKEDLKIGKKQMKDEDKKDQLLKLPLLSSASSTSSKSAFNLNEIEKVPNKGSGENGLLKQRQNSDLKLVSLGLLTISCRLRRDVQNGEERRITLIALR